MNRQEIIPLIHSSMYHQIKKTGYATPVEVLMDLKVLSKEDYEKWRFGKVDYLERVCKANLSKLSFIMKEIRSYAKKNDLKPSFTYYKRWGQKKSKESQKLRFSKIGIDEIEKAYATHYVSKNLSETK